MDGDNLSGLLPKPPPPRPVRRDAAIAAAMRRFDGIADTPAEQEPPRVRTPFWKGRWGQIGAFASILLVAVISIPMALETPPRQPSATAPDTPAAERQANAAPQRPAEPSAPARDTVTPAGTPDAATPAATVAVPVPTADTAATSSETAKREAPASRFEQAQLASAPPPPAPPPPSAPAPPVSAPAPTAETRAGAPESDSSIIVTGSRARAPARESASPVARVEKATAAADREIVVSGMRTARPRAAARRGDWNACTVNDPEQSLRGCKHLVNPTARGAAGVAGARLADGLALAWRHDWDRAIEAFDQAIAVEPKLAFAYLNRGLAYQRKGELPRAAADLDQAVRHAPRVARGYYSRSIVRRLRGDVRGATADGARAADLDPRYDAVLD